MDDLETYPSEQVSIGPCRRERQSMWWGGFKSRLTNGIMGTGLLRPPPHARTERQTERLIISLKISLKLDKWIMAVGRHLSAPGKCIN